MRTVVCTFLLIVSLIASGCSKAPYEGPQRFPLVGRVSLNGEPVNGGMITFVPQSQGGRVSGGPIIDGGYSVPEEKGANADSYRVEIRWPRPTGKKVLDVADTGELVDQVSEAIPPRYNQQSELSAQVSETQTKFDFDLTSN